MLTSFYDPAEALYGFKDSDKIVIPAMYDEVEPFRAGFSAVRRDQFTGVINTLGQFIVPLEYESADVSSDGWVQAKRGSEHFLFEPGGNLRLKIEDIIYWYFPEQSLVRVKKTSGWGCIDLAGNVIIPFQYIAIGPVYNDWMNFYQPSGWGWLNTKGEVVVPAVFADVGLWNDHYWWGRQDGRYCLYDFNGEKLVDDGWKKIVTPAGGVAVVKTEAGWKYINEDFKTMLQLPPLYEWALQFHEGLAQVKRDGLWGYINSAGEEVIPPQWIKAGIFRECLAPVQQAGLWGFVDTSGSLVIPYAFREAGNFVNGRAWVCDAWNEWYINTKGEAVTEPVYWG